MRLNRRPSSRTSSGVVLDLATYGLDGLPAVEPDALPGDTVEERAASYVDALDLPRSTRRGFILWRVECLLDDHERERDGRPSYEDEILAEIAAEADA